MSMWGIIHAVCRPSTRVALLPVLCLLLSKFPQGERGRIPLSLLALRRRGRHFSNSWECSLMVKYLSRVGGHGLIPSTKNVNKLLANNMLSAKGTAQLGMQFGNRMPAILTLGSSFLTPENNGLACLGQGRAVQPWLALN